ncbi:nicotinate-nicotinamide nucleotide adenylyltransferase [Vibrio vulnificus]|uniref:nicotinate-nicotinamide nucleotide adenylyltransferase n=1 Tax=Vibrio vulnificus TaxID=672 RepID=UPI000B9FA609|nr:nicotinate-nicotinamide nucleotide adenylyltransferase [Vibrio vulnificus]EGR8988074.1 nicotinate-nicotinamide nucleotide adenylyltransferase [Vibrio vulnificus]EHD1697224.1 nicotinate-nicotinamide nucleotide adenylyltransferase [Vibrio vulnificus]EHU4975203.1 nicotinate-nicotinamide nucleotide adenylyltransferase [Vibrio vulnificus]MCA0783052.1 nicotinate-nicotinamide nucleotide adenylyltransferase [Vibrio vulnificus]MCG8705081.1 nicotinate-nicotinamide nucleotide adenylyltransferase [Vibr
MLKIAVFGSAFNPPSLGHLSVIESLSHFDLVLLEPSIAHAWGKEMLDYSVRCELLDAFIQDLTLSTVKRSNIEQELYQPGESVTTYALLTRIQEIYPEADITFVIGPDNFFKFANFYQAEEITQKWAVMACPEKVQIRSTDIRHAIDCGDDLAELTTPSVRKLLIERQLYKTIP